MKKIIVIVARQRTGTTSLAQCLSAGEKIFSCGEVFHHAWDADSDTQEKLFLCPEASFFAFREKMYSWKPELSAPSMDNLRELFQEYLAHISSLTDKPYLLIDIKYNSFHHLESYYASTGDAPMLMFLLKQADARFIHLKRPRHFDRYCSEQIALRSGVWHKPNQIGKDDREDMIVVDAQAALADMNETARLENKFDQLLKQWPRHINLRYGALFQGAALAPQTLEAIDRLLGEPCDAQSVNLRKVVKSLWRRVENREEVAAFFDATEHREVVRSALNLGKQ